MNNTITCRAENGEPGTIAPEVFGALVHKAAYAIKNAVPGAVIYAGSLSVLPGLDPSGANAATFLDRMYRYLNLTAGVSGITQPYGYGWDALSVNIEGLFDATFTGDIWNAIKDVQERYGDFTPIIAGEWGTANEDIATSFQRARIRPTFDAIRAFFPIMYFFSHHFLAQDQPGNYGTRNYRTTDDSTIYQLVVTNVPLDIVATGRWYGISSIERGSRGLSAAGWRRGGGWT